MVWYPGKRIVQGARNLGSNVMDRRRDRQALRDRAMGPQGPAPQIGGADDAFAADRAQQGAALQGYQEMAAGRGPSVAQEQYARARQQGVVDQMGMASTARGGTLGAQQRQVAGMGAANAMGTAGDLAQMRAAEMQAGLAGQAGMASQMAGMSGGMSGQNAALASQWGLGQRGMDLQGLGDQRNFGLGVADRAIGLGAGVGQLAMFSDERLKTDLRDASGEAGDTLAALHAIGYRYKDKRHGPDDEETIGIKAQDLQKTPRGRRLVKEVPGEGLAVDVPGSLSMLLAWASDKERKDRGVANG